MHPPGPRRMGAMATAARARPGPTGARWRGGVLPAQRVRADARAARITAVEVEPTRRRAAFLLAVLALALVTRLHHFGSPLTDALAAKQVYVANKARSIARPPFNPLRHTLDFLDESGSRTRLIEEVPLYTGMVGLGYRVFGEREWLGRLLSIAGTLTAIAAFHGLVRRDYGGRVSSAATVLFAASPLLVFYGRAVVPDPWMLACMLLSALCYRRALDGEGTRWLACAALAGLAGAAFKYYGLMVLVPLAAMTSRESGWRGCVRWRFVTVAAVMTVPIAAWMGGVFLRAPNPVRSGWMPGPVYPYTVLQDPGLLLRHDLYSVLFARFLGRDCGPVTAALIAAGVLACWRGRLRPGPVGAWTAMGLAFYVLFGPKLRDHDYYELMMLPAAAVWAALGWSAIAAGAPGRRRVGTAVLAVAVLVHSPWVIGGLFQLDRGKSIAAERLRAVCPRNGRVVVLGPGIELPVIIHYSGREGWLLPSTTLPADWFARLSGYRTRGARIAALYFDSKATPPQREAYRAVLASCRTVEHAAGPWSRTGGRCEYFLLDLDSLRAVPERGSGRHVEVP
jgi:4-amino-4-deoxy-L-arabinose transferase-like glycosyltransferase